MRPNTSEILSSRGPRAFNGSRGYPEMFAVKLRPTKCGADIATRKETLLTRVRWINLCRARPEPCLQTGKRCFTNKG